MTQPEIPWTRYRVKQMTRHPTTLTPVVRRSETVGERDLPEARLRALSRIRSDPAYLHDWIAVDRIDQRGNETAGGVYKP